MPDLDVKAWYAVAFVLFWAVLLWKASGNIRGLITGYQQKIADELAEAASLRQRAEVLLAETQRQQQQAEIDAAALIARAKEEAEALKAQGKANLEKDLARRQRQAEERIALAEQEARRQIETRAVDALLAEVAKQATAA